VLVTCLVVLVLQAAHVGCFEAARFTDFPVGSEVNYEATEPIYKANVQADLPIITPPDGFVFPAKVGDEIEFKVAVKRGDGVSAGPRVVNIMFEETPEMLEMVEIGAVRKPIIEVIDREQQGHHADSLCCGLPLVQVQDQRVHPAGEHPDLLPRHRKER